MSGKAVDYYSTEWEFVSNWCKSKEMCNRIISENYFSLRDVSDQYKAQRIYDRSVDECLATLKFVPA